MISSIDVWRNRQAYASRPCRDSGVDCSGKARVQHCTANMFSSARSYYSTRQHCNIWFRSWFLSAKAGSFGPSRSLIWLNSKLLTLWQLQETSNYPKMRSAKAQQEWVHECVALQARCHCQSTVYCICENGIEVIVYFATPSYQLWSLWFVQRCFSYVNYFLTLLIP